MNQVGVGLAGLVGAALTGVILRLLHKLKLASNGQEVISNAIEAKIIEVLQVFFAKKSGLKPEFSIPEASPLALSEGIYRAVTPLRPTILPVFRCLESLRKPRATAYGLSNL